MTLFTENIHKAIDFAAIAHSNQSRKDPDKKIPYVSHLFGVAYILAQYDFDENVIIAGLLHDIVEDQSKYAARLHKEFGQEVFELVKAVSEKKKEKGGRKEIAWHIRKADYVEHLRLAPSEAKAISCADKIHNIQSILIALDRGAPIWARLKASPKKQIQRFKMLHQALSENWGHPMLMDLRSRIGQLEAKLGQTFSDEQNRRIRKRVSSTLTVSDEIEQRLIEMQNLSPKEFESALSDSERGEERELKMVGNKIFLGETEKKNKKSQRKSSNSSRRERKK